jgi:uncharacterized protein YggT (Ycf19 family)
MSLIDFVLNLVGLLLWLNWRSIRFDPLLKTSPATLSGTLRRAEPRRMNRWHFLLALAALLLFRALLYWELGSALNWTPTLPVGAAVLFFGGDFFGPRLLFSGLSFAFTLIVFYLWLLFVSLVNNRVAEADPLLKLVRLHLGRIERWPWLLKLLLPFLSAALLWLAFNPLLAQWRIIPPASSTAHCLEEAGAIGLGVYLSWRFLIGGLLALYLLSSYIFLGRHPFWSFIAVTGRNSLRPLRWLPLRVGKVDFAPVVAIALTFLAAAAAEQGLTALYQRLPL